MRRLLLSLAIVASFLVGTPVFAETIHSFDVTAKLTEDRNLTITEVINYDFEGVDRHGIYRDIPVTYMRNGAKYRLNLDVIDVKRNGKSTPWKNESEDGMHRIRIGDANAYVSGQQTYTITYATKKAINSFKESDELYWNVTGNLWTIPRKKATFTLDAPTAGTKADCFTGIYGSPEKDCTISNIANNPVTFKATRPLNAGEDLTIVIAFPPGTVKALSLQEKILDIVRDNIPLFFPIGVFVFMFVIWFIRGRDPRGRGVVITQFEEPHGLRPAEMAFLLEQRLPKQAVTATIMDLARRGYIKLVFTGDPTQTGWFKDKVTFTLVCKKERDEHLNTYEDEVMCKLFGTSQVEPGDEVKLKDIKKFYEAVQKIEDESVKTLIEKKFFSKNPEAVRGCWGTLAFMIFFVSFFFVGLFGPWIMLSCAIAAAIVGIFSIYMPRTTREGSIAREEVEGFKRYLSVSEGERIKFHNAPEKKPELFERYLPAAIAFGVEEAWANQFKDIDLTQPSYISGNTRWNSFTYSSLSHTFNSAAASSIYPAPSSGGSGGSGFSGGGSGGGGGGGGGGSW